MPPNSISKYSSISNSRVLSPSRAMDRADMQCRSNQSRRSQAGSVDKRMLGIERMFGIEHDFRTRKYFAIRIQNHSASSVLNSLLYILPYSFKHIVSNYWMCHPYKTFRHQVNHRMFSIQQLIFLFQLNVIWPDFLFHDLIWAIIRHKMTYDETLSRNKNSITNNDWWFCISCTENQLMNVGYEKVWPPILQI